MIFIDVANLFIAVNCGGLINPVNGAVFISSGTTFRNVATYTCNIGYNLTGVRSRMCGADRKWSSVPPICQGTAAIIRKLHVQL